MDVKVLEIRDRATFLPVLCVDMNPKPAAACADQAQAERSSETHEAQRYLLRRYAYPCDGKPNIAMTPLRCNADPCCNDPYHWGDRTRRTAHLWIIEHWAELRDGDVVDVEFILGETEKPKLSERETEL